jgi:hypothetical protein
MVKAKILHYKMKRTDMGIDFGLNYANMLDVDVSSAVK